MTSANKNDAIERLFHPRNVVLVGASDRPDHWSRRVWDNLQRFGFAGTRLSGQSEPQRDLGHAPASRSRGAARNPRIISSSSPRPRPRCKVLRDGATAGARSGTLYAAGFGEGGDADGLRLATDLRAVLADTGLTIVGPNCMGVACGKSNFCSIPDETLQELAESPVAVVAQSGAICASINRAINELGLKVSYFASCGGQIGCTISDFIDYFAVQPELRSHPLLHRGHPGRRAFPRRRAARPRQRQDRRGGEDRRLRDRPHLCAGTHRLARRHRRRCSRPSRRSAGVVRLLSLEDAIEAVEFLARSRPPRGSNIAAVTNSGALRNLIAEAADRTGATLAPLSEATCAALRKALNQSDITNPLDTKRTIPPAQYAACVDALVNAPEVDIVLCAEELPRDDGAERRVANLRTLEDAAQRAAALGKAVAVFTPFITGATDYGRTARAQIPHVPVMRDIERTLRIMRALAVAKPAAPGPTSTRRPPTATSPASCARAPPPSPGPTALNEVESKSLLRAYGIPLPQEFMVHDRRRGARRRPPHRLPGRAQGGVGRGPAQERCRPGAAQSARRRRRTGAASRSSRTAAPSSTPRSTASWSPSRSPAAPNACSA